ncbi:MAG: hypothetical protein V2A73_16485, partial [Pseudomonadota bacterium]
MPASASPSPGRRAARARNDDAKDVSLLAAWLLARLQTLEVWTNNRDGTRVAKQVPGNHPKTAAGFLRFDRDCEGSTATATATAILRSRSPDGTIHPSSYKQPPTRAADNLSMTSRVTPQDQESLDRHSV